MLPSLERFLQFEGAPAAACRERPSNAIVRSHDLGGAIRAVASDHARVDVGVEV